MDHIVGGKIAQVRHEPRARRIVVELDAADAATPVARLAVEAPAGGGAWAPDRGVQDRGAYTVPLAGGRTVVTIRPR